jgi:hypothetical protein
VSITTFPPGKFERVVMQVNLVFVHAAKPRQLGAELAAHPKCRWGFYFPLKR